VPKVAPFHQVKKRRKNVFMGRVPSDTWRVHATLAC
jgi:hypothetical protein